MLAQDKDNNSDKDQAAQKPAAVVIGGEPVVTLQRPTVTDTTRPQFLEATILPGRGMAVLQIKALPARQGGD